MDKAELHYEKCDSVEVARNAKGQYGWKIKLYFCSPDETINMLISDLKEADTQLQERFL